MADLDYFLEKVKELKEEDLKGNLSGKEYLTKLTQIIFTYCPGKAYYKNSRYYTIMLINDNTIEDISTILKKELELSKWIENNHH